MPDDLTAIAHANSASRRTAADALVASDTTGRLERFRELANQSCFGSNVFADKITTFDAADELLDARRIAIHKSGGDVTAGLSEFARRQGDWFARREAFEALWEHGPEFLYGALNAGGIGAVSFGDFCIVVSHAIEPADALAVFPEDSLQRYTNVAGDVDVARARVEVTSWSARGDLVVVDRAAEVVTARQSDWPRIVSRADRYFEVVRAGRLPLTSVAEVRLTVAFAARLDELQLRARIGVPLTATEANELAAYDRVQGWRRLYGVAVVEVA